MSATGEVRMPSPDLFFQTARAYQGSAAIKSAVELDVFTMIGEGATEAAEIAKRVNASERGIRILCDYLVILGFLTKSGNHYALTPDSATFLDRRSPMCIASAANFLCDKRMAGTFDYLTESIRKGRSAAPEGESTKPENPMWVQFAESMAPMMASVANIVAGAIEPLAAQSKKALDIAAGHGMFGITLAQRNPQLEVSAVDWPQVLEVAKRNAHKLGVADRFNPIAGSAFEVDFGGGYDLILLPNFLHHFSREVIEGFLKKIHAALVPSGAAAIVEFVPNEDRVTPEPAAGFALTMLSSTLEGDAYTYREYESMLRNSGFSKVTSQAIPPAPQTLIIAAK
jgi:2-polyprenyl-3-methyl-5-hydroxy-6-metoxy-1,4-benzoquinol methylase